jgi:hypothetical protein
MYRCASASPAARAFSIEPHLLIADPYPPNHSNAPYRPPSKTHHPTHHWPLTNRTTKNRLDTALLTVISKLFSKDKECREAYYDSNIRPTIHDRDNEIATLVYKRSPQPQNVCTVDCGVGACGRVTTHAQSKFVYHYLKIVHSSQKIVHLPIKTTSSATHAG